MIKKNEKINIFLNKVRKDFAELDTCEKEEVVDILTDLYVDDLISQAEEQIEVEDALGIKFEAPFGSPEDMQMKSLYLIDWIINKGYDKKDPLFVEVKDILWEVITYFDETKF